VIGYDTFDSIRKKHRSEVKDSSDYYNITVAFLVRRKSMDSIIDACRPKNTTIINKIAPLADKGFPYDDADRDEALMKAIVHERKAPSSNSNSTDPEPISDSNLMI
jgi:hypothetical protein